jgi:hypothetical protein
MNECASCHLDFGSVRAFDAHRVGKHEYTYSEGAKMDPIREDGRRCLTVDEMTTMQKGGHTYFVKNAKGRWSIASDLERARNLKYATRRGIDDDDGDAA